MDEMANNNSPYAQMFYHKNFETNYREIVAYLIENKLKDDNFAKEFQTKASTFSTIAREIEPLVHKHFTKYAINRGIELAKLSKTPELNKNFIKNVYCEETIKKY